MKYTFATVLCFSTTPKSRRTVAAYYKRWRLQHGPATRCDNPVCPFHSDQLVWNGEPLSLLLDHENGNRNDNRPENLRLLCPNCDSQLPTRGGKNKGRVRNMSDGGFDILHRGGRRDRYVMAKTARITISVQKAKISRGPGRA
jgi:hypothetical protein